MTIARLLARREAITARPLLEALGIAAPVLALPVVLTKHPDLFRALLGIGYLTVLGLIVVHDARSLRAPNRLVYLLLASTLLGSVVLGPGDAIEAWLGGGVAFVVLLLIAAVGRGAMGLGDVKVGAVCGAIVGLQGVAPMILVAFLGGAAFALVLLVLGAQTRKDAVPFTPFLLAGTVFSLAHYPLYLWS